jgi:hypothetical protein
MTKKPKRRSRRLQFSLKTLLLLVVVVALALAGWRYWTITRPMRELARAISKNEFLSQEEKHVLRQLAWEKRAWQTGLIEDLFPPSHVYTEDMDELESLVWQMWVSRMEWSGTFVYDNSVYRVLLFQRSGYIIPSRRYPVTCIITDDNYRLHIWKVIADQAMEIEKASITTKQPPVLEIICGGRTRTMVTYRYCITPESIDQIDHDYKPDPKSRLSGCYRVPGTSHQAVLSLR